MRQTPRSANAAVHVVPYAAERPHHRLAFRDLNLAWIGAHFVVEARDRRELDNPDRHTLANGGRMFMAEAVGRLGAEVLGTCATDYARANMQDGARPHGDAARRAVARAVSARRPGGALAWPP